MMKTLLSKSVTTHGLWGCFALVVACAIPMVVSAQTTRTLRIVSYNIDADQGQNGSAFTLPQPGLIAPSVGGSVTNGGVLEGIGEEVVNGDPAQPIDILALEETTSNAATVVPIVNGLNTFYSIHGPAVGYAMSTYQATESGGNATTGNGPNALVYNTNTVQLLASVPVDPPGGVSNLGSVSGEYREVMRYEFAPAGVTATTNNEFYIYVSHYKASSGSANEALRLGEATIIRNDEASNLPPNSRVLYVGDYNPDNNSGEPAYQTICSNSAPNGIKQGQGVDPLNILWGPYTDAATTINWSSTTTNTNILFMLSEESYELRYRDDLQVMTSNVYYDVAGGLQYVPGTYHSFGNNATTPWGIGVTNSSNTALNGIPTNAYISRAQCYTNLTTATDHLPVVADYTIPITPSAPVASFTASPTNGVAPLGVTFTDTSTGSISNWSWTFGDGGTTNLATNTVFYTYNTPGVYSVTEIVRGTGGSSTDTVANCIKVLTSPPVASFNAGTTGGAAPLTVGFADTSSGSITGWAWAFGDGNVSTNQNPSNIYANPGVYTVREIVSGLGGSSTDTVASLINVYDPFAWWQLHYFGSTNNPNAAPGADSTGTGMSNSNKYLAGFNPTNSTAYLHIINIVEQTVAGNANVVVTYLGTNGDNTYTPGIQSRTNVLDYMTGDVNGNYTNGIWQDTGQTNILGGGNGSGIVTNMTDTAIPSSPTNRFYRVRVLLP